MNTLIPLPKENTKKLANRPAVIKYLQKNVKGFSEEKVFITHKHEGKYQLVIFYNGKVHTEEFYDAAWALDVLTAKLEQYCTTGIWDFDYYYQPYTSKPGDVYTSYAFGPVLRVPHHLGLSWVCNKFRNEHKGVDLGFKTVGATPSAVYYT